MSTSRKTAVITGGNSGVGFETAKVLARDGWRVVITGRDAKKLETAAKKIKLVADNGKGGEVAVRIGDYASFESVRALAAELNKEPKIDVLLNCVGISLNTRKVSRDGNDMMLQVNHLSHFLLTHLLLEKIKASAPARIINVSSRLHRQTRSYGFEDFQFEHTFSTLGAYGRTKLYNLLFTFELAKRLKGTGVTVNAMHPGVLATNIGDFEGILAFIWWLSKFFQKPQILASKVPVFLATSPRLEGVSGKYYATGLHQITPSRLARNEQAAQRLWTMSAELTGLDPKTGQPVSP